MSSTIAIEVLYFAVFRERVGRSKQTLQLASDATVAVALRMLEQEHSTIAAMRDSYRIAVNQDFVDDNYSLKNGDTLVLIPPVSGGARYVQLFDQPLSVQRCIDNVEHVGAGGIATFTGNVRAMSRGQRISHLEYEAYGPMAVAMMNSIVDEIETQWPGTRVAVEHRIGTLQLGEAAVVIAASAPHRAEAFAACQAMIDRLKDRVPIWKKEFSDDGAVWVGLGP
jgi:MoaE-MoaD fusion protein